MPYAQYVRGSFDIRQHLMGVVPTDYVDGSIAPLALAAMYLSQMTLRKQAICSWSLMPNTASPFTTSSKEPYSLTQATFGLIIPTNPCLTVNSSSTVSISRWPSTQGSESGWTSHSCCSGSTSHTPCVIHTPTQKQAVTGGLAMKNTTISGSRPA